MSVQKKNCSCAQRAYGTLVAIDEAKRFVKDCMVAAGATADNAIVLANLLTEADSRGQYSHGMNRLGNTNCCYIHQNRLIV